MTISVGEPERPADLGGAVFAALTGEFFTPSGEPIAFNLRDKRQTQDDPFDEHIGKILTRRLPNEMRVFISGKPLISPDLVIARPEETRLLLHGGGNLDSRHIIGIEVKKLNATKSGAAARGSGMDYNSTPPCSTIDIIADNGQLIRITGFYLYVILQSINDGQLIVNSLALVSGAAINEDVELYDEITGIRQKAIGLGSYGDGLDRQRPMLVFANPLGWRWTIGHATLVHPNGQLESEQAIKMRRRIYRMTRAGETREFFCYRINAETPEESEPDVTEPFPTPPNRTTETTARGRFRVSLAIEPK